MQKQTSDVLPQNSQPPIQPQENINGQSFSYWLNKNKYYHSLVQSFYKFIVPHDTSVLHINCKNGYLIDAIKPMHAIGLDVDPQCIAYARKNYPRYQFVQGTLDALDSTQTFDYILLSFVTMECDDVQALLENVQHHAHAHTRIVVETYSYVWEPILRIAQKLGLRRQTKFKNWLASADLNNILHLAGFDVVTTGSYMLLPMYIPVVSWFINAWIAPLPVIRNLCLHKWVVARPMPRVHKKNATVSVVITCRNEAGNIERVVKECPRLGSHTELIFVEGGSKDNTLEEIQRVAHAYKDTHDIKWFVQGGKGKGDAVRKGFAHATGDILMILDGDLTMPAEQLPKFFDALVSGKGEFINGSRLVYSMEPGAMRFLNMLANFFFGVLFSWTLGQRIKDTLCGTKVLWRKDYERIAANRHYFGLIDPFGDFDLLFGAAKRTLKIVDLPVPYKSRTYGQTNIRRFWHGFILLGMSSIALRKFKFR
ncbi:MAG TPA: bifunctional class I SAM-dependent methyltransferase/glycosyltransferase family 2 protein [Candidatus Dependentiae bacterium]|nr:bifunctional class I SAM-dependent methyltransferase/glycosyltransferase family 2 protein [Candidatus Dependentiae bacterium]HRQ63136.1 bifunctional class I SAM-dependent methyltransferase/glycosyltransferase family 2 protein [Candidatus Dependentiae bacterium]